MSGAEDLFESITLEAIKRFVHEKQEEHLHLDFKTADSEMTRDDRKNLAKAVSGFANSDGGVIVWGIDARVGPDAVDRAQELKPIAPLDLFMSRLTSHAGGAANPTVDGVIHLKIPVSKDANEGYAKSLVPRSDSGPHMAKLGVDRYFKRSGDRFFRMEHFDIEDMFGKRKRPVLKLVRRAHAAGSGHDQQGESRSRDRLGDRERRSWVCDSTLPTPRSPAAISSFAIRHFRRSAVFAVSR